MKKLDRFLLRSFLRKGRELERANKELFLQPVPNPWIEASRCFTFDSLERDLVDARKLLQWPEKTLAHVDARIGSNRCTLSGTSLRQFVKELFICLGNHSSKQGESSDVAQDFGIEALRVLNTQIRLSEQTSKTMSNEGILVVCTPIYTGTMSIAALGEKEASHVFYYRVVIINTSKERVQLLNRHWVFASTDTANGNRKETIEVGKWAPGIVGEQPLLEPQQGVSYMSHCKLRGAEGVMSGAFQLLCFSNDKLFEAAVGETPLRNVQFAVATSSSSSSTPSV